MKPFIDTPLRYTPKDARNDRWLAIAGVLIVPISLGALILWPLPTAPLPIWENIPCEKVDYAFPHRTTFEDLLYLRMHQP